MRSAGPIAAMALVGYLVDKDIDSIRAARAEIVSAL